MHSHINVKLRDLSNEKQICTPLRHKSVKKNIQLDSHFSWFIFNKMSKYHRGYVRTYSDVITRDMGLLRREKIYYKNNKKDWTLIFYDIPIPTTFDSRGNQSYQTQIFIRGLKL